MIKRLIERIKTLRLYFVIYSIFKRNKSDFYKDLMRDWGKDDVDFTLRCIDYAGSGCQKTEYKIINSSLTCDATGLITGTSGTVTCPTDTVCQQKACFRSTDIAGNVKAIWTSDIFKIDKEKPTSVYIDPTPPAGSNVTADFNLYVDDSDGAGSGLDICRYTVYDSGVGATPTKQDNRTCDGSFTVTVGEGEDCRTVGGTCTVSVYAYDVAGNSGTGQSRTYNIALPCIRANPTVTPTNSPQTGNPGEAKTFTFNITNNDTAGCDPSSFNLSNTCLTGFNCSLNKSSVTINPGATDSTVTLTLTSPAGAAAGGYTASLTATNSSDATKTATGTVTYQIICTRANPGVSLSPSSQPGNPGPPSLNYTATIINYDSLACGSSVFNLTKTCPTGWTCSLSSETITISPNGSLGAVSLSVTSPTTASAGNYTVSVTATNSGATSYSGTGSATYTVVISGPVCGINVQDSGVIGQWIFIDVSSSQGAIASVKFSSDNNLNGSPDESWDGPYEWDTSSGDWNAANKTMIWSFANAGSYEVWAELNDGAGNTSSCYDTILIFECYAGQTGTCTSPQGCQHTITCQPDGTWPLCPTDICTANTQNSSSCPCPGIDGCSGNDYYDYPPYGNCNSSCSCDVGISSGQPCEPTIYPNDSRCVGVDQCNSDTDCDDGNPCTINTCNNPEAPDSFCSYSNEPGGTSCGACKQCDGNGNCVNRPDGYNTGECGDGCQRCVYGSCQDYNQACEGTEASCECHSDSCIDCSNYGEDCNYDGICHCGPLQRPVWSCSDWQCSCTCEYDDSCEIAGGCQRANPEVVLSPSSKTGNPGETLTYDVTVINEDLNCGSATFTLTSVCPTDWPQCEIGSDSLTIDAGQSGSTTLSVTSPDNVSSGNYNISVTATNNASGLSATGSAQYIVPNQSPFKPTPSDENGVTWNHCSQALSIPTFQWKYDDPEDVPPGADPQTAYEIRIDDEETFFDGDELIGSGGASHYFTPSTPAWRDWKKRDWNTDYWWIVKVKDSHNNWSDWSDAQSFTTPLHAAPSPDFEPSKVRVSQKEVVTFIDYSLCYLSGDAPVSCKNPEVACSYEWDFDYIEPDFTTDNGTKGNVNWSYTVLGAHYVRLRITDDLATCYSEVKMVTVTLPLPRWWEIPPF